MDCPVWCSLRVEFVNCVGAGENNAHCKAPAKPRCAANRQSVQTRSSSITMMRGSSHAPRCCRRRGTPAMYSSAERRCGGQQQNRRALPGCDERNIICICLVSTTCYVRGMELSGDLNGTAALRSSACGRIP